MHSFRRIDLALKKMAKKGSVGAKLALDSAAHPERILSATLFVTDLCIILISSLITLHFLKNSREHGDLFAILICAPLVVIFGELIPKTIYQRHATKVAPWVARPVNWAYWIFFPITRLIASYTNQPLANGRPDRRAHRR